MAITIRKLNYRPWPVTVRLPVCDEATGDTRHVEQTFILHFRPFLESEFAQLIEEADLAYPQPADGKPLSMSALLDRDARVFTRVVCGWNAVMDEAGVPVPYSETGFAAWLTGPDGWVVNRGVSAAINELRLGGTAKNAVTSLAPGPAPAAGEASTDSAPATVESSPAT